MQIVVEAMSKLAIRESPDAVTTYEMYRAIKEIKKLKKSIPKESVISVVIQLVSVVS